MRPETDPAHAGGSVGRPLHIGYVLKRYPRFSETFVVNEVLAHEQAGARLDLFALGPVEETHFQDGISRVRAPVMRIPGKPRSAAALWQSIVAAQRCLPHFDPRLAAACDASGELVAQAIDVAMAAHERGIEHLHAHFATQATTVARMAAAFSGLRYSFTAHAKDIYFDYEEPVDMAGKLRDAAFAVTVSDYNLAWLHDRYGAASANAVRLYNGIDLARFAWRAPRPIESLSGADADPVCAPIIAVGRLVPKKGFEVLVDAIALLATHGLKPACTLIGDGPLRESLQQRVDALGLSSRITIAGLRPQPDVIEAMRSAAMVVAPCTVSADGDRDGLPTVLLEAMALGAPCISTRVAGIPELVRDGETGLCVAPGDPAALAVAMQRLLADSSLRQALSQRARRRIECDFDVKLSAAMLRRLIARACRSDADGRGGSGVTVDGRQADPGSVGDELPELST